MLTVFTGSGLGGEQAPASKIIPAKTINQTTKLALCLFISCPVLLA
jgi:hypothetical protein